MDNTKALNFAASALVSLTSENYLSIMTLIISDLGSVWEIIRVEAPTKILQEKEFRLLGQGIDGSGADIEDVQGLTADLCARIASGSFKSQLATINDLVACLRAMSLI